MISCTKCDKLHIKKKNRETLTPRTIQKLFLAPCLFEKDAV